MASKRRQRRKQQRRACFDKEPYASEKIALDRVYYLLRRNRKDVMTAKAGFLRAYRCQFCSFWHIGNSKDRTSTDRFIGKLVDAGVIK